MGEPAGESHIQPYMHPVRRAEDPLFITEGRPIGTSGQEAATGAGTWLRYLSESLAAAVTSTTNTGCNIQRFTHRVLINNQREYIHHGNVS